MSCRPDGGDQDEDGRDPSKVIHLLTQWRVGRVTPETPPNALQPPLRTGLTAPGDGRGGSGTWGRPPIRDAAHSPQALLALPVAQWRVRRGTVRRLRAGAARSSILGLGPLTTYS